MASEGRGDKDNILLDGSSELGVGVRLENERLPVVVLGDVGGAGRSR